MEALVPFLATFALVLFLIALLFGWLSYRALSTQDNSTSVDTQTAFGLLSLVVCVFSGLLSIILFFAWWLSSR